MAYRYTNTDKWSDAWFSELTPYEKLVFIYLCDNCDMAGFIEYTPKKWAFDIGFDVDDVLGALEGLSRGLIYSESKDCIFLRNFLKHQKNLPLNEKNNAHLGIIKRFNEYKNKFKIENIESFINQEVKPLLRGYGNGNGNGNGNSNQFIPEKIFEIDEIKSILEADEAWIETVQSLNHFIKAKEYLSIFTLHKKISTTSTTISEFKKHFGNWLRGELKRDKLKPQQPTKIAYTPNPDRLTYEQRIEMRRLKDLEDKKLLENQ
jgi:hypothetical protein